ncbi:MAG TPA: ATP synthase F1 subunit delta [Chthonomonadales bacterium]|nr:ATP synthase F1 subunit delta [Chthonomonadales bacterium]
MAYVANIRVARRYAAALFGAARQLGAIDAVQRDLANMLDLWRQAPVVPRALESPLIPASRKRAILDEHLAPGLSPVTHSFLRMLIDKRRESVLAIVGEEFGRLADEANGIVRAVATVAAPLTDEERDSLVASIAERTGRTVDLHVRVDPVIIGGAVVRIGDIVYDGSVRGALERLRERMLREHA